jgi:putative intracellular protease/amidase
MRRVVIVAFPGVQTLDVTGPAEVLRAATLVHPSGYEVTVVAPEEGPLRTSTVALVRRAFRRRVGVSPADLRGRRDSGLVTWVAHEPGIVRTDNGMLGIQADAAFEDLPDPEIAGPEVAQAIQLGIEYDPQPPFDAGSPATAAAEIVELVRGLAAARPA